VTAGKTHSGTALLVEAATALQLAVKLSLGCKLQDEVNARRIVEVTVEAQYVGVPLEDEDRMSAAFQHWGRKSL
jgi:uncharacterized protein YunC (DUF1805 family)